MFFITTGLGTILILSYPDLSEAHTIEAHLANCICLEFDKSGRYFATGAADALASLWDVKTLSCLRTFTRLEWPVRTLSFNHDSQLLASASEDHFIDIAHVETGEQIASIKCDTPTFTIAFHPKYNVLAYACDDNTNTQDRDIGTVKLWSAIGSSSQSSSSSNNVNSSSMASSSSNQMNNMSSNSYMNNMMGSMNSSNIPNMNGLNMMMPN